jgi:hypothetical protein
MLQTQVPVESAVVTLEVMTTLFLRILRRISSRSLLCGTRVYLA